MTASKRILALGAVVMHLLAPSPALSAPQLVVIANRNVEMSAAEVADVFLGDKLFAGPVKLVPVDNALLQEAFLVKVLKLDAAKYSGGWVKKSFREGLNPPPLKSGDAEVIEYVKHTPGAIGYVGSVPAGVTVIQKY